MTWSAYREAKGASNADREAYAKYQAWCAQLQIHAASFAEYLKETSRLQPSVLAWTGTH